MSYIEGPDGGFVRRPHSEWPFVVTALVGHCLQLEEERVVAMVRFQERIAVMMHGGASLDRVEAEVIDGSDLNSDQKAALWTYASSFLKGREREAGATRYLTETGH
jgi:hypothetical protein